MARSGRSSGLPQGDTPGHRSGEGSGSIVDQMRKDQERKPPQGERKEDGRPPPKKRQPPNGRL